MDLTTFWSFSQTHLVTLNYPLEADATIRQKNLGLGVQVTMVAIFLLVQHKKLKIYTIWPKDIPSSKKIYQMAKRYTKWPKGIQMAKSYTKWSKDIPTIWPKDIPNGQKLYKMVKKYTKWPKDIQNGQKICQMAVNYVLQTAIKYINIFHFKALQNVTRIGIKIYVCMYHLAITQGGDMMTKILTEPLCSKKHAYFL
jgi:hypothetical protein